ncbi:hypothetical protein [Chryseobacterium geocarposphaerae]|uniref:Uncharacterized protein n=1 Tax=Chryseobacterium geocarposphaerae TaxID=1416776 RepID=A0A2M9C9B1_9FLAO|nr:hypothetical protein [Chryseobacterium geocarposphaerae]PJJ67406.1 hypothetical protein CLV73_1417 [Chryseobacterium geocarposphaerae]
MDIKYAYYNTSKGYRVVGGTAAHFLKADGSLDGTEYIDKYSEQNILGRKYFSGAIGNSYNLTAIETRGNGSTVYPSIGFHQPGQYAATLSFRSNGFNFMDYSGTLLTDVNAAKFIKGGSDDSYLLLGGGGHLPRTSFASGNYRDYQDNREINPNEISPMQISYGFTTWNNDITTSTYADFLHFGGYTDASGGQQNLIAFNKNGFGIRQFQGPWQDGNRYSKYVDYFHNGATIDYSDILTNIITAGASGWAQRKLLGRGWNPTYGDHVEINVPGSTANTASLKLNHSGGLYVNDNLVWNAGNFNPDSKDSAWLHSGRDFTQGTRILTNIDYSQWSGAAFLVEIKGNMYGGGMVMDCKIQGYIYNDTIINAVGYSTHPLLTEIIALNLNGELCFWFPRLSYWQGFSVKVTDVTSAGVTTTTNRAYQIADAADPGGIKRVRIPIATIATQNWINGQSFVTTNTVQAITALKEFYTTLAMANGQSIYLKGSSDTAHYIRHFSDDTDGFGVSSGFAVKNYSTLDNLFQVTSTGFGEFKQNVRAGGFLKAGSSNNFVLLGYGDHKPLSDFWTSANFNPATKVNTWENAYALGFSSGSSTGAPYIYHATDGYVFLATQSWVSSNFANQIQLNVEFTTNLGTGLMLSDDKIGGESGLIDIHQKAFIAGKIGEYYKYGSSIDGLEGINYDLGKKNIGIGGDIDSNKVRVEGCVKAIGNFKSEEEKPDTMFIPDGQIATLRDEIVNAKYAIRLNPHEYGIDAYSTLDVDDRNRLIHIVADQVDMRVNFNKIYPKQQIVIYNFDQKGNGLEVQINGKTIYYIEQHCFLRLYVTNSLRVIAERQQPCDFVW